ncbi:MAG: hypothetical protein ACXV2C_03230, partial [Candidatus Bathyarchaeia archaeon]
HRRRTLRHNPQSRQACTVAKTRTSPEDNVTFGSSCLGIDLEKPGKYRWLLGTLLLGVGLAFLTISYAIWA